MKTLYHWTTPQAAREIVRRGFLPGADGFAWLAEHPTSTAGEKSRACLVECKVSLPDDVLDTFRQKVEEEVRQGGKWVRTEATEFVGWYRVPHALLNQHCVAVIVTASRRRRLIA